MLCDLFTLLGVEAQHLVREALMGTFRQPPIGHMPFPGHRNQKQVREEKELRAWKAREAVDPAKLSHDQLPWCPQEYREAYQRLRKKKHLGAAEARRIIEAQIAHDKRCATFVPVGDLPLAKADTVR